MNTRHPETPYQRRTRERLQRFIATDPVYQPPPAYEMGQFVVESSQHDGARYLYFKERAGSLCLLRKLPR